MGKAKWIEHQDFTLGHVPRTMKRERYEKYRQAYRKAIKNILRRAIMSGQIGTMINCRLLVSEQAKK